jgi:hypothetical protein
MTDYQAAGIGGIIFLGILQAITIPMDYQQRRTLYRGLYSLIVSKIEDDPKYNTDQRIGILISGTELLLDQAGADYRSSFESRETFDPIENNYAELLSQIFDKLCELTTRAKIIEKISVEQGIFE